MYSNGSGLCASLWVWRVATPSIVGIRMHPTFEAPSLQPWGHHWGWTLYLRLHWSLSLLGHEFIACGWKAVTWVLSEPSLPLARTLRDSESCFLRWQYLIRWQDEPYFSLCLISTLLTTPSEKEFKRPGLSWSHLIPPLQNSVYSYVSLWPFLYRTKFIRIS